MFDQVNYMKLCSLISRVKFNSLMNRTFVQSVGYSDTDVHLDKIDYRCQKNETKCRVVPYNWYVAEQCSAVRTQDSQLSEGTRLEMNFNDNEEVCFCVQTV